MKNWKALVLAGLVFIACWVFLLPISAQLRYEFVTKWGSRGSGENQFDHPKDVAVDRAGNVYVADGGNNRIQKIDPAGRFWDFASGSVNNPGGVAVNPFGLLYVADTNNNRILKLDVNGNILGEWGTEGTGNGQFKRPVDVAVDSSGNVYVVEWTNSRVQKFDRDGRYLMKWGKVDRSGMPDVGSGDGEFLTPRNIAVDRSGNVFVADSGNSRIQKFNSNGRFLAKWPVGVYMSSIYVAVDGAGNVYVSDAGHYCVHKFNSMGNLIMAWGAEGSDDNRLFYPQGLALDSANNVYVADASPEHTCIKKFRPIGMYVRPTTPIRILTPIPR